MTVISQKLPKSIRFFTWRNPDFRALVYQVLALGSIIAGCYYIITNTFYNLEKRGITTGFSFLSNEAGFGISEVMPIPMLEGGFLYFLGSLVFAVASLFVLKSFVNKKGKTIGEDYRLILLSLFLMVLVPAITYYLTQHSIVTKIYDETNSYSIGLMTGIINTLKVSILGCIISTVIGFTIGIARLSSNWLVSLLAAFYIEVIRNIPLLLQIFFWYFAVISSFPGVNYSLRFSRLIILNNRGIYLPDPVSNPNFPIFLSALFISLVGVFFWGRHTNMVREKTGRQIPFFLPSLAILLTLPSIIWLISGSPVHLTYAVLEGFNFVGGLNLSPEFAALLVALSMYHGSFIAETVRSGIQAVSKGQKEAAAAVGLKPWLVLRLVVIPQALRVIIPPLSSQYLNLTKNSSLGIAIAYMDLVAVGGTILNQSGQAIEIILIWMLAYLIISLLISMFMNWYNAKIKLVER